MIARDMLQEWFQEARAVEQKGGNRVAHRAGGMSELPRAQLGVNGL